MEFKEAKKIVIAKPVPWKPTLSNYKSFSELLAGEVSASPLPAIPETTTAAAIRPRTVRFKPARNNDLIGAELVGSPARFPSDKVSESNVKSTVVYKPIAKLVSNTTFSLLAKLRNRESNPAQETDAVGAHIRPCYQNAHLSTDFHQNSPPHSETKKDAIFENPENGLSEKPEIDQKSFLLPDNGDRPAYDGHNWRKYGQKQVKGSEYPRSYYKCTYPNCPVKKKVERTTDGQIAEIVYKGEHNHPKPHPLKHNPVDGQLQKLPKNPSSSNQQQAERIQRHESPAFSGPIRDPIPAVMCNNACGGSTSNNSVGQIREREEVSESLETVGDDVSSKRRKSENLSLETNTVREAASEHRIVVQNGNDSEIIGDGYRWRKYGQKVVKGNPYPRSYYRCTSPKCNVRKHVERTSEDPSTCITTYEGRHNHEPIKGTNSEFSKTSSKNKP